MERIEAAILRTVLYADVFDFPLTVEEIHHFLIYDEPVSLENIRQMVETSDVLTNLLAKSQGYIAFRDRHSLISRRIECERASQHLWPLALRYGTWLARLPFVRMVAITGALAVRNPSSHNDDLDYMIVTTPGRVWLARAFAILLVRFVRLLGIEICPNYVLADNKLTQQTHDIFLAHEVVQCVPIYGDTVYQRFRTDNVWVEDYLPNADGVFHTEAPRPIGRGWGTIKRLLETLLGGRLGDQMESWEYHRKLRRFQPAMQNPHSSAQIDATQIKGHFYSNSHPTLQKYWERLREYGLDEVPAPVPGD